MNQETITVTPEAKDLITQVYPEADVARLEEWLVGSTHGQGLIGELEKNRHDVKNAGISRLGILVEACANYHFRTDFERDDRLPPDVRTKLGFQILETAARNALPGDVEERAVSNKMAEIYNEGVGEVELAEGVNVFQIQEPASTLLAETVEEVVDEWVANDSLQMQLRTVNLKYEAREQALRNANQRAAEAERKLAEVQEAKPAPAEKAKWDEAAREKARLAYEVLPARKNLKGEFKVRDRLEQALAALDPVAVKTENINPPESLAETDKGLIAEFQRLPEVFITFGLQSNPDMQAAVKAVFGEKLKGNKKMTELCDSLKVLPNAREVVLALPDILRFRLEERRKDQEQIYAQNREKKAVIDFFATHEVKIEVNEKDGIIVDDDWLVNLERAEALGYEPLSEPDSTVGLKIDTKLEDITSLSIILRGKAGRINKIFLESQRLNKDSDQYDRESRLNLIALDETRKEFRLVRQFSEGKQTFFVYKAERKIGIIGFNDAGLLINWEEMSLREGLEAVVNVVNLLEETPWGGDKRLKGLLLTAATKGEEKKPEEMPLPPLPQPEEKPVETVIEAAKPAEPPALETKEEEKSQQQRQGLDF